MGAPIGVVAKCSVDPAEAANHLEYCKKTARKLLKTQMETHHVAQDMMYVLALANYHARKNKTEKEKAKVERLTKEFQSLGNQQAKQMFSGKSLPVAQVEQNQQTFRVIAQEVYNLFLADLDKNAETKKFLPVATTVALCNKNYADLRKWIDGFQV